MRSPRLSVVAAAVATALSGSAVADAVPADIQRQLQELQARIQQLEAALAASQSASTSAPVAELDQKVKAIERRLEVKEEVETANRLKTPVVALSDKGLSVATPDGNFELKLRGYVQADGRIWEGDDAADDIDTFLVRRARPVFEGTVFKQFYYRIMPDFAGSSVSLQDAYAEWRHFPFAKVAVGKFKAPIGLERLASGTALSFVERGLPTNLVPNRDVGVMLNGDLFGGYVSYAAGIFNGVQDLGSVGASDPDDNKDFAGRIFVLPFKDYGGVLQGLGIGLSGSIGSEDGSASSPALGSYVTPGQSRFFRYRTTSSTTSVGGTTVSVPASLASTTVADGDRYRWSPHGYWYWRQFGLLGEYVESSQTVAFGAHRDTLTNTAWQIAGSWVLTGEEASYKGVAPLSKFSLADGTWGAFELVARYGELDVDDDAFSGTTPTGLGTAFADPRSSASHAASWGAGINWYLNKNLKLNLDYENTWFEGGGGGTVANPLDRETEHVVLTRVQVLF